MVHRLKKRSEVGRTYGTREDGVAFRERHRGFLSTLCAASSGGNVYKVSKEVTDGDTTKKKGRLVILHKIVETMALRNKG